MGRVRAGGEESLSPRGLEVLGLNAEAHLPYLLTLLGYDAGDRKDGNVADEARGIRTRDAVIARMQMVAGVLRQTEALRGGGQLNERIDVTAERQFVGFDAHDKVIGSGVDATEIERIGRAPLEGPGRREQRASTGALETRVAT